jgi:flagellar capping protein FliD
LAGWPGAKPFRRRVLWPAGRRCKAAKRIPVDRIETRITETDEQIAALDDLRALMLSLRNSLSDLRGAVSLDGTSDVFAAKQLFASTTRIDGTAPSAAGNLVGASTSNAAVPGTHTFEVRRVAAAHKVASKSYADQTSALSLSGSFKVAGKTGSATVTVAATDSLQDIRDRINAANSGTTGTGVTASVLQVSSTEFILVVTADDSGQRMAITEAEGGTVLSGLGLSSTLGTGGYRNGLAASKIEVADGFDKIIFDGKQVSDASYEFKYDQASKTVTATLLDGTGAKSDTFVLTQANGTAETATFTVDGVGITVEIGTAFNKGADITVAANATSVTGGTGAINAATVEIVGSAGDISGITSETLTLGNLAAPAAISVTVGGFTGSFDGTGTGDKTVTLSDASGNSITVKFNVTATFDGTETAGSITLNSLQNVAAAAKGANFDSELQDAQTARLTADGLVDQDRFESDFIVASTALLSSLAPNAATTGDFVIKVGTDTVTVNYDKTTDTVDGLVTKINTAITAAANGVTTAGTAASLMTDGSGSRLVITNTDGSAITLTDTDGLLADLGVDNDLVVERSSNTISDLFTGVTLTLFQPEEGTTVKLDIEQNLATAKSAIEGFVESYNAVKQALNQHALIDSTGEATEDTGVLFGTPTLFSISSRIASVFGQDTKGVSDAFAVLAQIGVTLVDNGSVADPLLFNNLEIDDATLDNALLNNADDVRRLFAFDFKSSDPRVSLLGFTGQTSYDAAGYKVNINFDDLFGSTAFTDGGSFTRTDATTSGATNDGISAITFDDSLLSGEAYRYSYDGTGGELLTLTNLNTGVTETVDITTILDAAAVTNGAGNDLAAGETATVNFSTLNVTLTLTGDGSPTTNFKRATDIITTGATDVAGQVVAGTNNFTPATATVTYDNDGGITDAGVQALKTITTTNGISYDPATGKLNIAIESDGANVTKIRNGTGSGVSFQIDGAGGFSEDGTSLADLEDGLAHSIEVQVGGQVIATVNLGIVTSTGAGTDAAIVIDVGEGLFSETSTTSKASAPMENYLTAPALTAGNFDIKDKDGNLLGNAAYTTTDSLFDLASTINGIAGLQASVVQTGGTFQLQVNDTNHNTLTFENDTGNLLTHLTMSNVGDGVFSANIGGSSDGADNLSATVNGRTITATDLTTSNGLKVFYSGSADTSAVQVDYTVGFGARLFFSVDEIAAVTTGLVDSNVIALKNQNEESQKRADAMLVRLDLTRQSLLQRFINMEIALTQAKNLQESISSALDSIFNSGDS